MPELQKREKKGRGGKERRRREGGRGEERWKAGQEGWV